MRAKDYLGLTGLALERLWRVIGVCAGGLPLAAGGFWRYDRSRSQGKGARQLLGPPPFDERIGLDGKVRRLSVRTDRQDALALSNLMNKLIVDIELF